MFDVAWSEMLTVGVVALVVVGPKDMPRLMRSLGRWAGQARAIAGQFRVGIDQMMQEAELDELRRQAVAPIQPEPAALAPPEEPPAAPAPKKRKPRARKAPAEPAGDQ